MNRVQLLSNVSNCKKEIQNIISDNSMELARISMLSMGNEILNTQQSWTLKGKIESLEEVVQLMSRYKLFIK